MNINKRDIFQKKKKKRMKSRSGSTMVELIVAFAVLLLAMASWSKVVTLTTDIVKRSIEMREQRVIFEKCYYLGSTEHVGASSYQMFVGETRTYGLIQVKASGESMPGAATIAIPITLEKETLKKTKEGKTSDILSIYVAK